MDLARAPCRAPLTARKKGSGYENVSHVVFTRNMEISGQEINTYKPFYNYINIDLYLYVKSSHYVLFKTRVGDIKREAHNLKYDYKRMLIRANNYIRILTII